MNALLAQYDTSAPDTGAPNYASIPEVLGNVLRKGIDSFVAPTRVVRGDAARLGDAGCVLEGVGIFANFLLESEADVICGASRHQQSERRLNYRAGWHARKLRLALGTVSVRVPNLRCIHVRPSMAKRFKRHERMLVDTVSRILGGECDVADVEELIRVLWTLPLSPGLGKSLAEQALALFREYDEALVLRAALVAYYEKRNPQSGVPRAPVPADSVPWADQTGHGWAVY